MISLKKYFVPVDRRVDWKRREQFERELAVAKSSDKVKESLKRHRGIDMDPLETLTQTIVDKK